MTASIVLYKSDVEILKGAINNFLNAEQASTLYLVDNSPTDDLRFLENIDQRITYIFNPVNPGFGAGHNIAIKESIEAGFNYHFIINPDVVFTQDVIGKMLKYMKENSDVGMMMPEVLNEDGTVQNLPKLLPSPFSVVMRKIKYPKFYYNQFINEYELRFVNAKKVYNAPILSGCFTLLRLSAIKEIGMYDDRFFMYFEDWDLSRRMHQKYKTIYFPHVSIIHGYESGANKNKRLFKIFIKSANTYFKKWGWFTDKERSAINSEALKQFK